MAFTSGETVVDVLSCTKYTASAKGEVDVKMSGGMPSVLVPEGSLKKSTMCGYT
jgi:alpha-amylase